MKMSSTHSQPNRWTRWIAVLLISIVGVFSGLCILPGGFPVLTIRRTQTLVGFPPNEVLDLIDRRATFTEIEAAAKKDPAGTLSYRILGGTLLNEAIENRRVDVAGLLLGMGIPINPPPSSGVLPPLISAVNKQSPEMVEFLLKRGADPWLKSPHGYSAVECANAKANLEVQSLINRAASTRPAPSN